MSSASVPVEIGRPPQEVIRQPVAGVPSTRTMPVLSRSLLIAYCASTFEQRAAAPTRIAAPWLTIATDSSPVPAASATAWSNRSSTSVPRSPPGRRICGCVAQRKTVARYSAWAASRCALPSCLPRSPGCRRAPGYPGRVRRRAGPLSAGFAGESRHRGPRPSCLRAPGQGLGLATSQGREPLAGHRGVHGARDVGWRVADQDETHAPMIAPSALAQQLAPAGELTCSAPSSSSSQEWSVRRRAGGTFSRTVVQSRTRDARSKPPCSAATGLRLPAELHRTPVRDRYGPPLESRQPEPLKTSPPVGRPPVLALGGHRVLSARTGRWDPVVPSVPWRSFRKL